MGPERINRRNFLKAGAISLAAICSSCTSSQNFSNVSRSGLKSKFGIKGKPRKRWGRLPSDTSGSSWLGPDIGRHNYESGIGEKKGMIYTPQGGFIDVAHLRKPIDWSVYLAEYIYPALMDGEKEFSFGVYEPSKYHLNFGYPENWQNMEFEKKDKIAENASINVGEYLAYTLVTWHEMLTWYGYKCSLIFPEFSSAFSWEDNFSNYLGAYIGGKAMRSMMKNGGDFSKNANIIIDEEMKNLGGILDKDAVKEISNSKAGEWYGKGGKFMFVSMKRRDFDLGLEDGYLTPVLAENKYCPGATPLKYPAITLEPTRKLGISINVKIDSRCQTGSFKRILGTKIVEPEKHFLKIVADMKRDCDKRGYVY